MEYARIDLTTSADFEPDPFFWWADGVGVDFTGCSAALALRVVPTDLAPAIAISTNVTAAGLIVLGTLGGGNPGLVQITILRAAIALVTAPVIHGEIVITMSDGTLFPFLHLDAFVEQGSTY